jgi:hypothetical protein
MTTYDDSLVVVGQLLQDYMVQYPRIQRPSYLLLKFHDYGMFN